MTHFRLFLLLFNEMTQCTHTLKYGIMVHLSLNTFDLNLKQQNVMGTLLLHTILKSLTYLHIRK